MFKKIGLTAAFLCCSMLASTALAASGNVNANINQDKRQYYKSSDLVAISKPNFAGGRGNLAGKMALLRENATEKDAIKELGFMTLKRGDFIGSHTHYDDECAYIITSGTGLFTNGSTERIVTTGDITIARPGQMHGLRNIGYEPLVFLVVLAQNDHASTASGNGEKTATKGNSSKTSRADDSVKIAIPASQQIHNTDTAPPPKQQEKNTSAPTMIRSTANTRLTPEQKRKQQQEEAKIARQNAKKAKLEAIEKRKKEKEDLKVQQEIKREKARQAKEKARREAKMPPSAAKKARDAELRSARADEAAWAEQQKEKIRALNQKELDDDFAIGIKK